MVPFLVICFSSPRSQPFLFAPLGQFNFRLLSDRICSALAMLCLAATESTSNPFAGIHACQPNIQVSSSGAHQT